MKSTRLPLLLTCLLLSVPSAGSAETIFWEDFDGYTYFPAQIPSNDWVNPGIPEISEGADEFWYAGRFEFFDNGTINQDLAVQEFGGGSNPTPVGRVEDEAGLLFMIPAGYTNLTFSFDWRTFSAASGDRLVVGYHVGDDLGFDNTTNRFRDFFTDDFGGVQSAAVNWWNDEWVEILRGKGDTFQTVVFGNLPDNVPIWIAFWLDNGEGDYGKIDNVHVTGTLIPEPSTAALLGAGLLTLIGVVRRRF